MNNAESYTIQTDPDQPHTVAIHFNNPAPECARTHARIIKAAMMLRGCEVEQDGANLHVKGTSLEEATKVVEHSPAIFSGLGTLAGKYGVILSSPPEPHYSSNGDVYVAIDFINQHLEGDSDTLHSARMAELIIVLNKAGIPADLRQTKGTSHTFIGIRITPGENELESLKNLTHPYPIIPANLITLSEFTTAAAKGMGIGGMLPPLEKDAAPTERRVKPGPNDQ